MAGAFIASPEMRAYASTIANDVICNGYVGTSDLAGNAVTAAKIKDNEVKAAEIATDAVGASEIQGVSRLIFAQCTDSVGGTFNPGTIAVATCLIGGAVPFDTAIATKTGGNSCFLVESTSITVIGEVNIKLRNVCQASQTAGSISLAILVFDK